MRPVKVIIPIVCKGAEPAPEVHRPSPTVVGIPRTGRQPAPEASWAWLSRAPFFTWCMNGMRVEHQPADPKLLWFIGQILQTYDRPHPTELTRSKNRA